MGTSKHVCTLTIYTQRYKFSTSLPTQKSAAGFHNVRAPAESVDRSRMHTVKISLHLTPSAELCSLYSKNARVDEREQKEYVREGRQRTACRKDGAPDVKDNQITAHLSLCLSASADHQRHKSKKGKK